jgi:hypothetical protein
MSNRHFDADPETTFYFDAKPMTELDPNPTLKLGKVNNERTTARRK